MLAVMVPPFIPAQGIRNCMFTQLLPSRKSTPFNYEFATYAKISHPARMREM